MCECIFVFFLRERLKYEQKNKELYDIVEMKQCNVETLTQVNTHTHTHALRHTHTMYVHIDVVIIDNMDLHYTGTCKERPGDHSTECKVSVVIIHSKSSF